MEAKLKEQDEQLIIGNNKIAELSQTVDALKAKFENPAIRSEAPRTAATPSSSSLGNTAVPSQLDRDFTPVRHGAKPTRRVIQPTKCSNRFQILEEQEEPERAIVKEEFDMVRADLPDDQEDAEEVRADQSLGQGD